MSMMKREYQQKLVTTAHRALLYILYAFMGGGRRFRFTFIGAKKLLRQISIHLSSPSSDRPFSVGFKISQYVEYKSDFTLFSTANLVTADVTLLSTSVPI